jgi:glycosyltransferase involved in cell wall biosynthesis
VVLPRLVIVREQVEDREIANWLPLREHVDLAVVTTFSHGPYAASGLGLPVRRLPSRGQKLGSWGRLPRRLLHRRLDLDLVVGLEQAIGGADVVVVNETHLASSTQAAALRADGGPPVLVVCYENVAFRYEDDPRLLRRKRIVRAHADGFVALTSGARRALEREGVEADRIATVTYGVDPDLFGRGDRDAVRREWGARGDVVVLFAGRLLKEKGLVPLIDAFAALPAQVRAGTRLVMAGDGPEKGRIGEAVRALGVGDRVQLLPWVARERVPHLLAAADVYTMPSLPTPYWEEQLGFSMIEAMAAGLPVLGTDGGCIPEILGGTGVLAPPYQPRALAAALETLLTDEGMRARLGAEARARVGQHLSTSVAAAGLRSVVMRLVG